MPDVASTFTLLRAVHKVDSEPRLRAEAPPSISSQSAIGRDRRSGKQRMPDDLFGRAQGERGKAQMAGERDFLDLSGRKAALSAVDWVFATDGRQSSSRTGVGSARLPDLIRLSTYRSVAWAETAFLSHKIKASAGSPYSTRSP